MEVRVDASGPGHVRLLAVGAFDLTHAALAPSAIHDLESRLQAGTSVELDLTQVEQIDGAGAVVLARLLDRLNDAGHRAYLQAGGKAEAARMIDLYRTCRATAPAVTPRAAGALSRAGMAAAQLPARIASALDFVGRVTAALPKAVTSPASVDWRSLPGLLQEIGANALLVTGAANLLVGLIIGFLGVSQLGRFGAISYVPQLVVVAHFRELGPLVTAIVIAGRSGAGIASELATMKVSEEIDALYAMGFHPVRWLVIPRCLALAITVPLLTWIGNGLALVGGLIATTAMTHMTVRAYVVSTLNAITATDFLGGLIKSPFLAVAIGLIACGQGLATRGGAAAVGTRTTAAVVLSILAVIVIDALFTLFMVLLGF